MINQNRAPTDHGRENSENEADSESTKSPTKNNAEATKVEPTENHEIISSAGKNGIQATLQKPEALPANKPHVASFMGFNLTKQPVTKENALNQPNRNSIFNLKKPDQNQLLEILGLTRPMRLLPQLIFQIGQTQ